jgi:hypothetical protein
VPIRDPSDPSALQSVLDEVRCGGRRRLLRRRAISAAAVAALAAAIIAPISLSAGHNSRVKVQVGATTSPSPTTPPQLAVPDTYPCAGTGGCGVPIPAALHRPLHFPTLGPGQSCPTAHGRPFTNSGFSGIALGDGPVKVIIANQGDLANGQADLGSTSTAGWLALQTLWFASPAYNGPFVVRAERIGANSPIEVQPGRTGLEPGSGPLVVPPGPTLNSFGGYRTEPGSTWVTSPGCYAWQVDGLTFSDIIVVDLHSGILAGTLEAAGGAAPATPRPLPGTVTISAAHQPAITIDVGADGRFSLPLVSGTYTVVGRSPLYQAGQGTCEAPKLVTVTLDTTQHVAVTCQEK